MRSVQRLLTVFAVFTILFAGIAGTAMAQTQGGSSGTNTQQGGTVGGEAPTPKPPASTPKPTATPKPPASTPKPTATPKPPTATPKPSQGGSNTVGGQQAPGTTPKPPSSSPTTDPNSVPGAVWVVVDLSEQRIYVYKGNTLLKTSLVRTGKRGFETPTGTFYIHAKYRYKDMAACENGECWDTQDVPYSMLFANGGYYLHGAYWGSGWGYPASHGCVNLPVSFAAWLYGIAPNGTKVVVRW